MDLGSGALVRGHRLADRGRELLGRATDRVHRNRQAWSVRTAIVDDVRDVSRVAMEPWLPGSLTAADVTDLDAAFVADPFVVRWGGEWWLFVEVWDRGRGFGVIGAATSDDGLAWTWRGVVLEEPFHLSYPQVFEHEGRLVMIPETGAAGAVRLYEADGSPGAWTFRGDLITHDHPVDATVFQADGTWWCFVETGQPHNDTLRLYFADELRPGAPWCEHPASPIVAGDPVTARPAGRPVLIGGTLHRLSQSCAPRYGVSVRAHRIDVLTRDDYRDDGHGAVILHPGGRGWNRMGSHHLSTAPISDGKLLVAFDGY